LLGGAEHYGASQKKFGTEGEGSSDMGDRKDAHEKKKKKDFTGQGGGQRFFRRPGTEQMDSSGGDARVSKNLRGFKKQATYTLKRNTLRKQNAKRKTRQMIGPRGGLPNNNSPHRGGWWVVPKRKKRWAVLGKRQKSSTRKTGAANWGKRRSRKRNSSRTNKANQVFKKEKKWGFKRACKKESSVASTCVPPRKTIFQPRGPADPETPKCAAEKKWFPRQEKKRAAQKQPPVREKGKLREQKNKRRT